MVFERSADNGRGTTGKRNGNSPAGTALKYKKYSTTEDPLEGTKVA